MSLAPGRRRGIVAAQTQAEKQAKEAANQPPPEPKAKRIKGKLRLKNV